MDMVKKFLKYKHSKTILISVGTLLVLIILFRVLGSGNQNVTSAASKMMNQHQSTLNVKESYTDAALLKTTVAQEGQLRSTISALKSQVTKISQNENGAVAQKLKPLVDKLKAAEAHYSQQFAAIKAQEQQAISNQNSTTATSSGGETTKTPYPVGKAKAGNKIIWLNDQSIQAPVKGPHGEAITRSKLINLMGNGGSNSSSNGSLLNPHNNPNDNFGTKKPKITPAFTIPANTMLTGITPDQPLIGMIMQNSTGTVWNPQSVLFQLSSRNMAANYKMLPPNLKGVQGRAECRGIFVWFTSSYVSCQIKSLTFIFNDGTISTQTAKGNANFGYLATAYGSSFIPGKYHGNAAYAAAGTGVFSALQGVGNAFSAAQQAVSQNANGSQTTTYKSVGKTAMGAGVGAFGQAENEWWQRLLKSTTDFVYADNWNSKTHKLMQLNAVVTKQIDINHDSNARKIEYANQDNASFNNSLN